ncbi:MAG TPA: MFS transporter [Gaiellaceae bacterium]|nr:MFS transporter [Gaiellaceae bacterium]
MEEVVVPPLGLARYRALFRVPHVRLLVSAGLVARLPMGMVPLALVLLVRDAGGSYSSAGLVSGAYFVAAAIGLPVAGRLVDTRGQARILLRRAVVHPALLAGVCVLALAGAPTAALAACGAAAGALMPPVAASLRALWPRLFPEPELRSAAYALEASLQEVFFVVGPLLVALVAVVAAPAAALGVAAAAAAVGTLALALAPPVREWRPETERHASALGALESGGVRTIVVFAAFLGLGFGATEVAMPAFAEDHGGRELGSIPLALFAAGSLVGGLVVGARTSWPPLRLLRVSAALLVLGLAPLVLAPSLATLGLLAFVAGLPIAPAITGAYALIDGVARRGTAAEAFAWISTAVSLGVALGTAAGGSLVDLVGVDGAFGLACAAAAGGALLVAAAPGLRGR